MDTSFPPPGTAALPGPVPLPRDAQVPAQPTLPLPPAAPPAHWPAPEHDASSPSVLLEPRQTPLVPAGIALRIGQLTPGWRTVMIAGWIGFLTGFGAVLQAGRDVGISPWWAGPESDPRGPLILVTPFILGLITLIMAIRNHRLACWVGLAASFVAMAIAVKDGNRYLGLGQAQMVIAVAGLIVTIAAMSGRMRKAASQ